MKQSTKVEDYNAADQNSFKTGENQSSAGIIEFENKSEVIEQDNEAAEHHPDAEEKPPI